MLTDLRAAFLTIFAFFFFARASFTAGDEEGAGLTGTTAGGGSLGSTTGVGCTTDDVAANVDIARPAANATKV